MHLSAMCFSFIYQKCFLFKNVSRQNISIRTDAVVLTWTSRSVNFINNSKSHTLCVYIATDISRGFLISPSFLKRCDFIASKNVFVDSFRSNRLYYIREPNNSTYDCYSQEVELQQALARVGNFGEKVVREVPSTRFRSTGCETERELLEVNDDRRRTAHYNNLNSFGRGEIGNSKPSVAVYIAYLSEANRISGSKLDQADEVEIYAEENAKIDRCDAAALFAYPVNGLSLSLSLTERVREYTNVFYPITVSALDGLCS